MTRPEIIRADTLDLQDKTSPAAQDHTQQPEHPAPLGIGPAAPHQQESLRRVDEERTSEEHRLSNGWSDANTLRDDPGSDDERTVVSSANGDSGMRQDETAVRLNGGISGDGDDGEMHDADVEEDMDDDMMDKISSSPSIDDGGYSLPSYTPKWPRRGDSLTPESSPMRSPCASTQVDSSSPFTTTPLHFPLSPSIARRPAGVSAPGSDSSSVSRPFSPLPISFHHSHGSPNKQSAEHHRGEYNWPRNVSRLRIENRPGDETDLSPRSGHLTLVERRLQIMRQDSQMSLSSELDEDAAQRMLRPIPGPLDTIVDMPAAETEPVKLCDSPPFTPPPFGKDEEDEDSWTTDSDADSWDESLNEDDDSKDISFSEDSRFIDSGWGGECLRETEDIDFEFVYALHTFVATVEGQANATKGDTMVLLDDSNSYWWLVRVVKDNSIGYLPAEHIETPTERLARLNKHRNIDLSATMLGDTAEKSKNPLKKAMRRRNAKSVQFAPPTYVEASDYDYSSDEDDGALFGGADPSQGQIQTTAADKPEQEQDDGLQVQPLKVNGQKKESKNPSEAEGQETTDEMAKPEDDQRASDEIFDRPMDPKVSRNGTLRNTDSFFKDENTETRKITLTPNLLRDDSSTSTTGSRERGPSLESLEKNGFADKVKDDKKKKEKKPGMLSGLFKRKDKKSKGNVEFLDGDEKQSEEIGRSSPQSKPSDELSAERQQGEQAAQTSPQRNASKGKLQKPQRGREESPNKIKGPSKPDSSESSAVQSPSPKDTSSNKPSSSQSSTMRLVSPERDDASTPAIEERTLSPESTRSPASASKLNPMNMLKSQSDGEPRPEKVKKAKKRVQLDDFDSEEDSHDPFADPDSQTSSGPPQATESESAGRLSESPVHVSAADAQPPGKEEKDKTKEQDSDSQQPPGLTGDTSSQDTNSPISTPTPDDQSPSTSQPAKPEISVSTSQSEPSSSQRSANDVPPPSRPAPLPTKEMQTSTSSSASSESSTFPAWSDASLRTYLDDGSDIRDLLLVVNDTTGVVPVGPEHPLMANLYTEENKTMTSLSGQLDSLLNGLLESRMKKAGKNNNAAGASPGGRKGSR